MLKFTDIQDAFFFVSSASYGMRSAVLRKDTGQIFYRSEMEDLDEISDEDLEWDICIYIPHKNDLGLGQLLVFEFADKYLPDEFDRVEQFFRQRGAYSMFKNLLDSKGLRKKWYEFEDQREEQALWQWCEDNGIDISG